MDDVRRLSVLIVCDDEDLLGIVGRIVGDLGCDPTTVLNEVDAREILAVKSPNLVVVDGFLRKPPSATLETRALIEFARARNPDQPVLIFSAEPAVEPAAKALDCAFLLKPARLEPLALEIVHCLFYGKPSNRPAWLSK